MRYNRPLTGKCIDLFYRPLIGGESKPPHCKMTKTCRQTLVTFFFFYQILFILGTFQIIHLFFRSSSAVPTISETFLYVGGSILLCCIERWQYPSLK